MTTLSNQNTAIKLSSSYHLPSDVFQNKPLLLGFLNSRYVFEPLKIMPLNLFKDEF